MQNTLNLAGLVEKLNEVALLANTAPMLAMRALRDDSDLLNIPEGLLWVRAAIMFQAASNMAAMSRESRVPEFTEFDVHREFWGNLAVLIPGATRVVGPEYDGMNKPDGWVDLHGEIIPVEVKRDAFNGKARNQLTRYMQAYGARRGVAVATSFACETDPLIIRVKCLPSLRDERHMLESAIQPSLLN